MKRTTATSALCLALFSSAFVAGKGNHDMPERADSLRSVYLYTDGIKLNAIEGDSLGAATLFAEAIRIDSAFAPAYYELAFSRLKTDPTEAVELARRAYELDTANLWYHQLYGQALLYTGQYDRAREEFRRLLADDPKNPDIYRILAMLYEQSQQPFSAIAVLDSAKIRFGEIPMLNAMKRRLLISTGQIEKAIDEARALVDAVPYEAEHHVVLAGLYALSNKDSLARAEYNRALEIDSTSLPTLMALADFHNDRRDFRALLGVTKRMFASESMPLAVKVARFKQFTSDLRFYREFYPQLNDLATMLAIRYPRDKEVVELYAGHLIASGELEQALALYKLHLDDHPPESDYFRSVIDIESYLQRPDSVAQYVERALELFPGKAEFHIAKGNALSYSKQYGPAVKAYMQSLRHARTDSLRGTIWGMIGDTWHQMAEAAVPDEGLRAAGVSARQTAARRKAQKKCFDAYDRSLGYFPDNPLVMNNYAYFLAVEGRDLEKALAMSSRVVALTDNNPTYLDTHAWVLFRLGRTEEARKVMQQAVALDSSNSPELLVHYGDILNALGERFIAETYWRKALEKGYDAEAIARRMESGKK